jgi:hypothetical protein
MAISAMTRPALLEGFLASTGPDPTPALTCAELRGFDP